MTDETGRDGSWTLPPWWAVLLAALAIAAVAFAVGRFSTFGIVATPPTDDSPEAGFARDMQVHHGQAVDMAMTLYRTTEDDELRALAYDIATTQSTQKGEMFDWLVQWGLPQAGGPMMQWMSDASGGHAHGGTDDEVLTDEEMRERMGMASEDEIRALKDATGQEADCLFLTLMTRHHEGALPKIDAVLELGSEPRTLLVAERMRAAQTFEIQAMDAIGERLGCG